MHPVQFFIGSILLLLGLVLFMERVEKKLFKRKKDRWKAEAHAPILEGPDWKEFTEEQWLRSVKRAKRENLEFFWQIRREHLGFLLKDR